MENIMILALFPGQGSQSVGMGKELYDQSETAREIFAMADKALGFSLSDICFNGPDARLTETAITQPAILTVSTICFTLLKQSAHKFSLSAAAGHSLGEYSALVAAEAIDFSDAVQLVNKRGRYMQEAVPVGQGKMVAVLGKEIEEIEAAISKVTNGVIQAANINAPGQVVVAGSKDAIDSFVQILGGKVKELQVSAPFHCALMQPAEDKLKKDLAALNIKPAKCPVYTNFSAKAVTLPDQIRNSLEKQVTGKVRWVECMQNAIQDTKPLWALEFGQGSTLTGLLKRISPETKRANLSSLAGLEALFK